MSVSSVSSEKLKGWLQLLRVPNLYTVPGDPLAGFCLASVAAGDAAVSLNSGRLLGTLMAGLMAYCTGLLQNDYFDLEEDRLERPDRPLPSHRVSPAAAICAAILFAVAGLLIAFRVGLLTGIILVALLLVITIYNHSGKRVPLFGPLLMGFCRGLNFLLGASVLGWNLIPVPITMFGALCITGYIAVVTRIASTETGVYRLGAMRWGPASILVIMFAGFYLFAGSLSVFAWVCSTGLSALAIFWTFYSGSLLTPGVSPKVVQQTIGRFIRGLMLIQAAVIALAGRPAFWGVVLILVAWPVSQKLARHFYES